MNILKLLKRPKRERRQILAGQADLMDKLTYLEARLDGIYPSLGLQKHAPNEGGRDFLRGGFLRLDTVPADIENYVLTGMNDIDGWGINDNLARVFLALDQFQKNRGVSGSIFELGVHHGRASILMAKLAGPKETVLLVDLFEDQDANIDKSGHGNRDVLEANLAHWCPEVATEIVAGNSLELDFAALPGARDGFRFAHIDGGHHKQAVLNDLTKITPLLASGGVLIVDDFMHTGFPEVNECCHIFFDQGPDLAPVAMGQNKLILARPETAADLIAYLREHLIAPYGKPVFFHDQRCLCLDRH
jgi:hypothetical protein